MKRILSLLMAAVTSLSLAACSADTPEESQSTSQSVSADYSVDSTAAVAESQPKDEQSTAAADNAPSAEAAQSTTADASATTPETSEGSQPKDEQSTAAADSAPSAEASQSTTADASAATPETSERSQPKDEQSTAAADNAPSAEASQSTTADASAATPETAEGSQPESLQEDGTYSSRDDVALYIHTYGHLPGNFITKKEARELGWSGGSVEDYAPGKCIGGDHFGNYEGLLPEKSGRSYTECDIDTLGSSGRGAKRIIFSNDGLIYYTDDHYASFTLLYGEE